MDRFEVLTRTAELAAVAGTRERLRDAALATGQSFAVAWTFDAAPEMWRQ